MVRALRLAEMAMKIDVAIGVVMNGDRSDSFVDDYLVHSADRRKGIADLFQGGRVPLRGRYADAQPSLGMVGDMGAVTHRTLVGPG